MFFTDPTVTSFLKESFHELCEKYIHQYTLVHINNYEIIQRRYLPQVDPPLDSILPKSLKYFPDTIDEKTTTNQKYKSEIPIRRIKLEYNNSSNKNNDVNGVLGLEIHLDSLKNDTGYLLPSSSHPESKFAYIPYRYPRLATCIHWLLRCVGIKPRHSPEMTNDDAAESSSSGRSSNVDMPLISKPKNVLLA